MRYKLGLAILFLSCSFGGMISNVVQATEMNPPVIDGQTKKANEKKGLSNAATGKNIPATNVKKTDKAAKTKVKSVKSESKNIQKLKDIQGKALNEMDFTLSRIKLGESVEKIVALKGKADKVTHHFLRDEFHWDGFTVIVNNDAPYFYTNRKDLNLNKRISFRGMVSFYIDGKNVVTARGISVGDLRENVLRTYGTPTEVLWDGEKKQFHLIYTLRDKKIIFMVKDNNVILIQMSLEKNSSPNNGLNKKKPGQLLNNEFHLAGFKIGDQLSAYPWDTWEKKITNPQEETWYYSGYAVRVTAKSHYIETLFLYNNKMITARGLALGDDISTAELLYGKPNKMEVDTSSGHVRTSYIYFSADKRYIMILFFVRQKVDGILVTKNPQIDQKKNK